jgi:hypothetical protein
MGHRNPNSVGDNQVLSSCFGETFRVRARSGESAEACLAASYQPYPSADCPLFGWEAAWIDLGGEG